MFSGDVGAGDLGRDPRPAAAFRLAEEPDGHGGLN